METQNLDILLSRTVQDMDIVQSYRFFLGRDAEPEAVVAKKDSSRRDLIAQLVGSGEYEERVARPVLAGLQPSGDYYSDAPPRATLAWAAGFLPLEDAARSRLSRAPNWVAAYDVMFADARMRAAVPELSDNPTLEALGSRLAALRADLGTRSITGDLEDVSDLIVRGYALDRNAPDDILGVELWIDDHFVAAARADGYGRDLQERFGGSGRYGFTFEGFAPDHPDEGRPLRVRVLESGSRLVLGTRRLVWRPTRDADRIGLLTRELAQAKSALSRVEETLRQMSRAMGYAVGRWDDYWRTYYVRTPHTAVLETQEADAFVWRPRFDILITGSPQDPIGLDATLASVRAQTYDGHTVHALVNETSVHPDLTGDYAVVLNAGDALAPDALHRITAALQGDRPPALVAVDSDTIDGQTHTDPVLRPGFDYDLLLQSPGLGPTAAVRREVLLTALKAGADLAPACRPDLWLRVVETAGADAITHVARVLHHFGAAAPPPDMGAYAHSVRAHLDRTGAGASVVEANTALDEAPASRPALRVVWPLPAETRVSVIVPTRDRLDLLGPCLASLEAARTSNRCAMDVIVVDNASNQATTRRTLDVLEQAGRIRVMAYPGEFNWSAVNNFAARNVRSDVLVFLNNDTVALTPDWCDALCAQALRPDVGAVGARLLYEDGSIQHAGIVLGTAQAIAAHEGAGATTSDAGYMGRRAQVHRTAAVTGACLATRRDVFERLGGFDEAQLAIEANDVDYCLRARRAGLAILYEPHATLYHFESRSRGHTGFDAERRKKADAELAVLKRRWGDFLFQDPYYNPHFDRMSQPFLRLGPLPGL